MDTSRFEETTTYEKIKKKCRPEVGKNCGPIKYEKTCQCIENWGDLLYTKNVRNSCDLDADWWMEGKLWQIQESTGLFDA